MPLGRSFGACLRTAVDLLNDRVLPFFEEHSVGLERVRTDNGREYCARPLVHPYELYL